MIPSAQSFIYILSYSAKIANTSLLPLLSCVVRHCRTWTKTLPWLKWPLGAGDYLYPSPFSLMALCLFFLTQAHLNRKEPLSPSIVDLEPSSKSIDFPINPWEKRVQNLIREQLHWFLNSKEHLVHVLASGCVCYSWSLAPSQLEHRPWSLPTCVGAPRGL